MKDGSFLCRWKWNHCNIMPLCQNLKEEGGATESNDWSHVRIFWCQVQAERAQIHSIAPGVDSQRPLGLVVLQLHLLKSSQSDTRVCFLMAWCFWCACEKMQKCTWVSACARKIKSARGFSPLSPGSHLPTYSLLFAFPPPSSYADYYTRSYCPGQQ